MPINKCRQLFERNATCFREQLSLVAIKKELDQFYRIELVFRENGNTITQYGLCTVLI